MLMLSGMCDGVSVVLRSTILQLATPDAMRGRVSSINGIFIGSSNELGAFESGLAARLLGLVPSVVFGGCMTLLRGRRDRDCWRRSCAGWTCANCTEA